MHDDAELIGGPGDGAASGVPPGTPPLPPPPTSEPVLPRFPDLPPGAHTEEQLARRRRTQRAQTLAWVLVAVFVGVLAWRLLSPPPLFDPTLVAGDVLLLVELEDGRVPAEAVATAELPGPYAVEELWQAWVDTVPPAWSRRVDHFGVVTDGRGGTAAAMQAIGDERALLVDPLDVDALDGPLLRHTLLHELAHLVVMQDGEPSRREAGVLPVTDGTFGCDEVWLVSSCVVGDSLLGRYAAAFWTQEELDAARRGVESEDSMEVNDRYSADRSRYVSRYAATNPSEDLAESIAVLLTDGRVPPGSLAAAKLEWLTAEPIVADLIVTVAAQAA